MISGTVSVTPGQDGTLVFGPLDKPARVTIGLVTGHVLLSGKPFKGGNSSGCLTLKQNQAGQIPAPAVLDIAAGDSLYAGGERGSAGTFTYIG
jgi:hypothetical protein